MHWIAFSRRVIVSLGRLFRPKGIRQRYPISYNLGVAEGRDQGNAIFRAWLDRMEAAKATGEPFAEPFPVVHRSTADLKSVPFAPEYQDKTWFVVGMAEGPNGQGKRQKMLLIGLAQRTIRPPR